MRKGMTPQLLVLAAVLGTQAACASSRPRPEPAPFTPRAAASRRQRPPLVISRVRPDEDFLLSMRVLGREPEAAARYDDLILKHSQRRRLNPRLVKAIMASESDFKPSARSRQGARGLMQLMPLTAEGLGVPRGALEDPEENIRAGTAYLADLFRAAWRKYRLGGRPYRDAPPWVLQRIVAAYHSGPRSLGGPRWSRRTRLYVRRVLLFYRSPYCDFSRPPERRPDKPVLLASLAGI